MLSFEPNIIFIDDKEDEVEGIVELYQKEGYGTKYFNADLVDGDDKPALPFTDINLIFLDLYYKDSFDVELCTGWIESLIPKNAFYVLVIWSKDTHHTEEVIADLNEIDRSPYLYLPIQKSEEYKHQDNAWDFSKLHDEITTQVGKHHALDELSLWKDSIKISSNMIIGHLSRDANSDAASFIKKLQKIIVGHGGTSYISNENNDQKREVLFDALDDILISNAKGSRPLVEISEDNNKNLYDIKSGIQTDIDSMLNSWFHFKLNKIPLNQSEVKPGLICEFNDEDLMQNNSLLLDDNLKEYLKHQITESQKENSNTKLTDVALLISRPCDIAQNKYGRNLKLISGLVVYNPVRKENARKEFKAAGNKFDSIKIYDHLCFSDEEKDVSLIFDFRHIFSVQKDIFINKFTNVKYFNKELLSEILVEYSSYSSRLGITQII